MDTIRRLAESDPYWRGYLDGMTAAHHDSSAAHEYARLSQARIDRNTDTTDYDSEWRRDPPPELIAAKKAEVRERLNARRLGLPYPTRLDVDARPNARRDTRDEPTASDEWDGYTLCGR